MSHVHHHIRAHKTAHHHFDFWKCVCPRGSKALPAHLIGKQVKKLSAHSEIMRKPHFNGANSPPKKKPYWCHSFSDLAEGPALLESGNQYDICSTHSVQDMFTPQNNGQHIDLMRFLFLQGEGLSHPTINQTSLPVQCFSLLQKKLVRTEIRTKMQFHSVPLLQRKPLQLTGVHSVSAVAQEAMLSRNQTHYSYWSHSVQMERPNPKTSDSLNF